MMTLKLYWKIAALGLLSGLAVFTITEKARTGPSPVLNPPLIPEVQYSEPVRVVIPAIKVDAPVQPVGIAPDGTMGVTHDQWSVAWFEYGAVPGASGSAVLAGHLDTKLTPTAVFYDLKKLKPGDEILVQEKNGTEVRFKVRELKTYPYDSQPEEVFAGGGSSRLSLITCAGVWLKDKHSYSERLVVFADKT